MTSVGKRRGLVQGEETLGLCWTLFLDTPRFIDNGKLERKKIGGKLAQVKIIRLFISSIAAYQNFIEIIFDEKLTNLHLTSFKL